MTHMIIWLTNSGKLLKMIQNVNLKIKKNKVLLHWQWYRLILQIIWLIKTNYKFIIQTGEIGVAI